MARGDAVLAEAGMPGGVPAGMPGGGVPGGFPGGFPGMVPGGVQTEYRFVLPRGYLDRYGRSHREGFMRLATARDEIAPQADPRVRENPAYLTVALLARTVTRLGGLEAVDTTVIEDLFAADLAFLQDLYRRINQQGHTEADVRCPGCGREFSVNVAGDASGQF